MGTSIMPLSERIEIHTPRGCLGLFVWVMLEVRGLIHLDNRPDRQGYRRYQKIALYIIFKITQIGMGKKVH
jgi:hypothetical protein